MKHALDVVLVLAVLSIALGSNAGGSSEKVVVLEFRIVESDSYILAVSPVDTRTTDPYLSKCNRFQVQGTYNPPRGGFGDHVSEAGHRAALRYLQNAQKQGSSVNLGWIGGGFGRTEHGDSCIVRSKALFMQRLDSGKVYIYSYHDKT